MRVTRTATDSSTDNGTLWKPSINFWSITVGHERVLMFGSKKFGAQSGLLEMSSKMVAGEDPT